MDTSTTAQQSKESDLDLSKQVFSIIDSKIQYIKFMIKEAVKDYIDTDSIIQTSSSFTDSIFQKNASIFEKIEKYNKCLRRMLLLRNKLNSWNSVTIFDLITDHKYLNYTEDKLALMLYTAPTTTAQLPGRASDNY